MANDTLNEYMQTAMRQVRMRYLQRLQEQLEDLKHLSGALDTVKKIEKSEQSDLQFLAHKLCGTGTTYGFPAITEKGRALEQALIEADSIDVAALIPLIQQLSQACKDAIESDAELPAASQKSTTKWGEDTCILIVDDDENIRTLLASTFQETGCKVVTAENGLTGIEAVKLHHPDLILLDRLMPDIDGMVVLQEIKKLPFAHKTPVVFLTSKHTSSDILEGFQLGAVDYIIKPFNSNDIIRRCARFLK